MFFGTKSTYTESFNKIRGWWHYLRDLIFFFLQKYDFSTIFYGNEKCRSHKFYCLIIYKVVQSIF